jgi:hypothetical protein
VTGRRSRPPWWRADDELLDALGAALAEERGTAVSDGTERGAVPPGFVAVGKAAYAWYGIDAELAALSGGSSGWPALVRAAAPAARLLTYQAGELTVEIEVTAAAVQGQLVPAQPGRIDVRPGCCDVRPGHRGVGPGSGGVSVEADELGYFVIRPAPRGPFRLRCRTAGMTVLTDWMEPLRPFPAAAPARRRMRRQPPD